MSLDAWEKHALKSIADDLAASAPELASRLLVFNRLTSGESMPGDPRAKMGEKRRGHHRAWPRRGSWRGQAGETGEVPGAGEAGRTGQTRGPVMRSHGRPLPVIPVVAILAVVTAAMIAVALVLSGPGHPAAGTGASYCAQAWPITCPGR